MSVPGRIAAASLLLSLDPPPWFLRHSRAVAEVAAWLAARADVAGLAVDRSLVEAAGLLHDTDKLLLRVEAAGRRPHGDGSATWLAECGHPELAAAVRSHPVTRLLDAEMFERWLSGASLEERIVAYADKRAGQRLEPMADRFASWARRYPVADDGDAENAPAHGWTGAAVRGVRARAEALEADVCAAVGVFPTAVRRLRWTAAALAAARTRR